MFGTLGKWAAGGVSRGSKMGPRGKAALIEHLSALSFPAVPRGPIWLPSDPPSSNHWLISTGHLLHIDPFVRGRTLSPLAAISRLRSAAPESQLVWAWTPNYSQRYPGTGTQKFPAEVHTGILPLQKVISLASLAPLELSASQPVTQNTLSSGLI